MTHSALKPTTLIIAAVLTLSAGNAWACEPSDLPLYAAFEGEWLSDGNAFGQPAASRMNWSMTMDSCFWQVDYEIDTNPGTDAANTFMGRGVHIAENGDVTGSWIDNQAVIHRLRGTISDTELLVYWGEPEARLGRSRYTAMEDGSIQVTDWILAFEGWQQFNDNRFERVGD